MENKKPVSGITHINKLNSWVLDEIIFNEGIDLRYENYLLELRSEIEEEFSKKGIDDSEIEEELENRLDTIDFGYENDSDTALILFGDWKKDDSGKYIIDTEGKHGFCAEYSGFCGGTVSVEFSKTLKQCRNTSPCFIMSDTGLTCGDLDSEGTDRLAYSLPVEYFRSEND